MKHIITVPIAVLSMLVLFACRQWEMPQKLTGRWSCYQKVQVRTKENGKFVFIHAPDPVLLEFTVDSSGIVNGKLGGAVFNDCRVLKNRGDLERKLDLATDYVIKGKLTGAVFPGDPDFEKSISIPFNGNSDKMTGSIFQVYTIDLFPISGFDPVKN